MPYLRDLGISHVYLPPSFQARAGSTHGYDVVDPSSISNELGGEAAFSALVGGGPRGGHGDRARHRPEPHGDRRRQPLLGRSRRCASSSSTSTRSRAGTGASSTSTTWPRCARRTRRSSRPRTRWRCGWCARASSTGCGSTTRTGSPTPRATSRGCATAACEHVWVEKILDPGEHLRDWPVDGTVGYEFLNDAAALFVDPAGEAPLTDLWVELSGDDRRFGEYAFEAKLEQARTAFAPEVARLAREAPARVTGLERALASFGVYRTYVEPWSGRVEDEDRHAIAEAGLPSSLARVLELETPGWDAFVTRFQQTTPPVMAKGVEDTAFYRYARLLAFNDVGGDPSRFSLRVDDFHAANARARGALPEQPARHPDARHQALGRRARPDRRAGRDGRRVRGARAALAERLPLADLRRRAHAGRAVLHLPDAARRLADLRGAARRLPREGDARGQAAHELDRARRAPRGRGPARSRRALLTHREFLRDFEPFQRARGRGGRRRRARPAAAQADRPGHPRHLPGRRAALPLARGPRQPPRRRLGGSAARR